MGKNNYLCPSAPLYAGSKLLGIVNTAGEVDIIAQPIEVDEVFTEAANKGKAAEQKFRFVNKCLKSGCAQWTGHSCGIIERVLDNIETSLLKEEIPECGIRHSCRWFEQESYSACKVCTLVKYI
jgi:hypothetical protein